MAIAVITADPNGIGFLLRKGAFSDDSCRLIPQGNPEMLKHLTISNLGPAKRPNLEFGERLNVITGDNGVGKTFLLDACWYALTRTWADNQPFYPPTNAQKEHPPEIGYTVIGRTGTPASATSRYQFASQEWRGEAKRPAMPGLVIYARIDGGFSVWDPARNYWRDKLTGRNRLAAYQFTKAELWDGLQTDTAEGKNTICNGLLRDVENWRLKGNGAFSRLQNVLGRLSTDDREVLSIGEAVRVRVDDVRDIPTLRMPYGPVPVTQAAAGMRRVLALAYLLVWAWEEHLRATTLQREEPENRIVVLFDEVEAHLHPKWQRVFLPALLDVVSTLLIETEAKSVQFITTTHAPLVLASVETMVAPQTDRLFNLELKGAGPVEVTTVEWAKFGDASGWLTSPAFDMDSGYSQEAEAAMKAADDLMAGYLDELPPHLHTAEQIHAELRRTLDGGDPYWPLWLPYYRQQRGAA